MSAITYSREALRQAREQRETQSALPLPSSPAPSTSVGPPLDAPWEDENLVLAFWADWLGMWVSWKTYITTIPIERCIDPEAKARLDRERRERRVQDTGRSRSSAHKNSAAPLFADSAP